MRIDCIIDFSLGNYICLRGFAPLSHINAISVKDDSYQREVSKERREELEKFWTSKQYLYFPEVVLGGCLNAEQRYDDETGFFYSLQQGLHFEKYFDGFKIKTIRRAIFNNGIYNSNTITAQLVIPEKQLNPKLLKNVDFKKFSRIDGNHRLSVLDKPDDFDAKTSEQQKKIKDHIEELHREIGTIRDRSVLCYLIPSKTTISTAV